MKFFTEQITDMAELKKEYRKLAFQHHPDRGGNVEDMAIINKEYEELLKELADDNFMAKFKGKTVNMSDIDGGFREAIDKIIDLEGLEIEICGDWIWVSGDTQNNRVALKEAGYLWTPKKKMWYWRPNYAKSWKGKSSKIMDMSYIRAMYGSERIVKDERRKITA